jgi:hypothetical protein
MDFVGSEGLAVYRQKEVPLTFCGFELWLQEEGVCHGLSNYTKASSKHHQRFSEVLRMVKTCCAADIIEGALAGIYKPHLAWRYIQSSLNNTLCLARARGTTGQQSRGVFRELLKQSYNSHKQARNRRKNSGKHCENIGGTSELSCKKQQRNSTKQLNNN